MTANREFIGMDVSVLLLWGLLVGVVFSLTGAAGGILTSFGLMTVVGVADPNTVKPMAQMMTLAMVLVFFPAYIKRGSVVVYLGLLLALGSVIGAWLGSSLSSRYLSDMSLFRPVFGVLALLVAAQVFWKIFSGSDEEEQVLSTSRDLQKQGVHSVKFSQAKLSFMHAGEHYLIAVYIPVVAGLLIAMIAAIFGVGGGFLLVPFMASMLAMPMHIVPATAAIPVFIGGSVSIANYLKLGAQPDYSILAVLILGGVVGALLGPKLNSIAKDVWLKSGLGVIVLLIGLKYLLD